MNYQVLKEEIQVDGSQEYARLTTYLLDVTQKFSVLARPLILVCPGGGYNHTSEREGEIVALQFNAMGYHAAVLDYSCAPAVFPTALLELTKAVAYLRAHAQQWQIDPDRIAVLGFSAGGHLAASLGVFWNTAWFAKILNERTGSYKVEAEDEPAIPPTQPAIPLTPEMIRPNALILAYPVITSGEFAHRGSFDDLLGEERSKDEFWLEKMSLEKQDLSDVPPVFMWHTSFDQSVPLENSLLFFTELVKAGKPVEYHVFPGDVHGISLADWRTWSAERAMDTPAVQWIELAHTWLENWWHSVS